MRLRQAAERNWAWYKDNLKPKHVGWETTFAEHQGEEQDPHRELHLHFEKIFRSHDPPLPELAESPPTSSTPFTEAELQEAVQAGKPGKSVGEDQISWELMKAIVEEDSGR